MVQHDLAPPVTSVQIPEKQNDEFPLSPEQMFNRDIRYYLLANHILFALGWLLILIATLSHLFTPTVDQPTSKFARMFSFQRTPKLPQKAPAWVPPSLHPIFKQSCTAYSDGRLGPLVKYMQTAMLLQVPLVIKRRSILAAIQIIGRTYIIWGIIVSFPTTHSNPFYALLVLAWSASEVTGHTFDACGSMGKELGKLIYVRYAILSILYPLAALSEAALIFSTLPDLSPRGGKWSIYDYLRGISFVISKWSVWELARGAFYVVSTKRSWHELLRGAMAELSKLSPLEMFRGVLIVFGKLTPSELFHGVFFVIWWPGLYLVYAYVVVQRRKITKDEKPIVKSRSRLEVLRERKTK